MYGVWSIFWAEKKTPAVQEREQFVSEWPGMPEHGHQGSLFTHLTQWICPFKSYQSPFRGINYCKTIFITVKEYTFVHVSGSAFISSMELGGMLGSVVAGLTADKLVAMVMHILI